MTWASRFAPIKIGDRVAEEYWDCLCVPLTKGYHALIDVASYEKVSQHKWRACVLENGRRVYAVTKMQGKLIYLHRFILNAKEQFKVDHARSRTLDNRSSEIRMCTNTQNSTNTVKRKGCTSRYKGVCWHKDRKKWRVAIVVKKRVISLGYHKSEEEAAVAYNMAALRHFREFSRLNMIPGGCI
jgi:AP2 domain